MAIPVDPYGNMTSINGVALGYMMPNNGITGGIAGSMNSGGSGSWGSLGGMPHYAAQQNALYNAGNQAVGAAQTQVNASNSAAKKLKGIGMGMQNEFAGNEAYANQALRDAFDPQQEAYNRYFAQLTDATNSQEALRGIANTPYGAAVTGDAQGNFMTNWQMQAIQREQMGSQAASALQQQRLAAQMGGGQLINDAGQLNVQGAQALMQGYGIQGQDMQAALRELTDMFGHMVTRDKVGGGGGGGGSISPPGGGGGITPQVGGPGGYQSIYG